MCGWLAVSLVEAGHVSLPASKCLCVVPVSLCLYGGVPVCLCVLLCVSLCLRVVAVSVCICRREARPCLPALLCVCLCGCDQVCVCVCVCVCVFQDPRGLMKAKVELLGRSRRKHQLMSQELIDLLDTVNPP